VGLSCSGKSTIGSLFAEKLWFKFIDLDEEVEKYDDLPIESVQKACFSLSGYREKRECRNKN
jgi:shikimate kinase